MNGWILSESTDNYSDIVFQTAVSYADVVFHARLTMLSQKPYDYPTVANLLSPTDALAYVQTHAGASKSRDHVDDYLINTELKSYGKVGALISDETASPILGPGPISGGTAPTDTDGDGIPDSWESANGLNPNSAADAAAIASNGYASKCQQQLTCDMLMLTHR